ncbi:hypothetical protein CHS0354_034208 [Potamilus streckersoni]|uniref:FAM234A/B beta-propeller domain-containing protein n=1 Tax=Potamilus streckersoni TaxID=2493646 RepID=A0AAE0W689_9BIVA|nr:hypothetical protein CHS0354_034208 [Potamilus streckersoni]
MTERNGKYQHLLSVESDSEEDGEQDTTHIANATNVHVSFKDSTNLLEDNIGSKGAEYKFAKSRKNRREDSFCTGPRAALLLAIILLCFGVGYMTGVLTSWNPLQLFRSKNETVLHKKSANWRVTMADWGTESAIRLVDADGDGLLDIIIGLALGKGVSQMLTDETIDNFCQKQGLRPPCAGSVVALRGFDGKLLWKADAYGEIFALNCHGIDANKDGVDECIASGRLADMRLVNPRNGEILWVTDRKHLNHGWNIYSPTVISDMDDDGVNDIVISHGGDPTIKAEVIMKDKDHIASTWSKEEYPVVQIHTRRSGWLMLVSGATGKIIGRHLEMPEDKETYMSPVIHQRMDGSQYILYGSGGETVGGLVLAISIPDFYRYVTDKHQNHPVPNVKGHYTPWGSKEPSRNGEIEIFRSAEKGNMVPPVLVDVNKDGVRDILISCFEGTMELLNGETLEPMWSLKFKDRESYSTPAPGYFNEDDTIDFMVHWSQGAWPMYNFTDTIIIDGRDGSVLWNLTTNMYDVTSDVVARTTARNRDVFLFRVQGRNGYDPRNTGAVHGASGIQRIINKRATEDGKMYLEDVLINENNIDHEGVLIPESHFRLNRKTETVVDKSYIECELDQTVFLAELFALDRTVMKAPIKIWEQGAEKYYYKLTSDDRKLADEVVKKYGINHTMTQSETPWRGKRTVDDGSLCVIIQPDDRTTGAVGDVDGDGIPDAIVNLVSYGILRDEKARFVKMKFNVDIFKINLESAIQNELYTPINATIHDKMKYLQNENRITTLKFLSNDRQTWGAYMGTKCDSVYYD